MAVDVATEPVFTISAPRELFDAASYVTAGGGVAQELRRPPRRRPIPLRQRPRFCREPEQVSNLLDEIYLVTHWFEELRVQMGDGN